MQQKPRILVIDDVSANLRAMQQMLKGVDADLLLAESGNTGLSMALEPGIAVILLDVNMPDMDGFEVAELLGEMEETQDIPIIFLTASHHSEDDRLKGYNRGAIDYMQKPVVTHILLSKIHILLNIWRLRAGLELEISRREQAEREVAYLAQHDALTQLPNRRQLHIELARLIDRAGRTNSQFAVLFIDLDGFKQVNDIQGHNAGDHLLQVLAKRFKKQVRSFDIIARYGGDEFIIVLTDIADSLLLTGRLKGLIEQASAPVEWQGGQVQVGASVGVSLFPQHGDSAEELIQCADLAMYQAKQQGKGQFSYFSEQLNDSAQQRLVVESDIKTADWQRDLQLSWRYVEAVDASKLAVQAKLEWQHPTAGLLELSDFIALVKQHKQLDKLSLSLVELVSELMQQQQLPVTLQVDKLLINEKPLKSLKQQLTCEQLCLSLDMQSMDLARCNYNLEELSDFSIGVDNVGAKCMPLSHLTAANFNHYQLTTELLDAQASELRHAWIAAIKALGKLVQIPLENDCQRAQFAAEGCEQFIAVQRYTLTLTFADSPEQVCAMEQLV